MPCVRVQAQVRHTIIVLHAVKKLRKTRSQHKFCRSSSGRGELDSKSKCVTRLPAVSGEGLEDTNRGIHRVLSNFMLHLIVNFVQFEVGENSLVSMRTAGRVDPESAPLAGEVSSSWTALVMWMHINGSHLTFLPHR